MALSGKSTSALGILATGALIAASVFLVGKPLMDTTEQTEQQIQDLRLEYVTKSSTLTRLQEGSIDIEGVEREINRLKPLFPYTVNIESASRAVSSTVSNSSGNTLESFSFGSPVAVSPTNPESVVLSDFVEPFDRDGNFKGSDSESESEEGEEGDTPTAPSGGLKRVPVVINVTSTSYSSLGNLLEELSEYDSRLLFITGVNSQGGADPDDKIKATIYAFAYYDDSLAPKEEQPETEEEQ